MQKAHTPAIAWHAVIESVRRETSTKFAELEETIQLPIGKETDKAKSTSSPSVHDPIPTKTTIFRGSRLHEENIRQFSYRANLKEVQCGRRQVLVLADVRKRQPRSHSSTLSSTGSVNIVLHRKRQPEIDGDGDDENIQESIPVFTPDMQHEWILAETTFEAIYDHPKERGITQDH